MRSEPTPTRRRLRPPGGSSGVLRALSLALVLAGVFLTACGEDDDAPPRPFGPGSGGPPLANPIQSRELLDTGGRAFGSVQYHNSTNNFTPVVAFHQPSESDATMALLAASDGVQLGFSLISGRPDTPCRFTAALLARDEGYAILGDGADRINDAGVVFHEVWLVRGSEWVRLACAQLDGLRGVQVLAQSPAGNRLETLQVHFVLNSIR